MSGDGQANSVDNAKMSRDLGAQDGAILSLMP
jgi:hypothetical protein